MKIPRGVILGLALAIGLDTLLQIVWKFAVLHVPESASALDTARAALLTPYFYIALIVLPAQLFNWIHVLARTDLSFAQPITSLGMITILSFSSYFFGERITRLDLLGVALIFWGVFLISRTPYKTASSSGRA